MAGRVMEYPDFIRAKVIAAPVTGIEVARSELHDRLFGFQKDASLWALRRGRCALFERFGLGKTVQELECARQFTIHEGGPAMIVMPLGVRGEFFAEASALGMEAPYVRNDAEARAAGPVVLTNYERVRDGHFSTGYLRGLTALLLDEAACLRGFGGSKTFREMMRLFEGSGTHRIVATAVPSPNEFIELLAYAAFLDVMDVGQAKTRFFKRDATKADALTLHPHKEAEFFQWLSQWALFLTAPSDLGYSDEGYELPPLRVHWHELPSDHSDAGEERSGQGRLIRDVTLGVVEASREKRQSIGARVSRLMQLIEAGEPEEQWVVWADLNDEQRAIENALTKEGISVCSLYGSQDIDERESLLSEWKAKRLRVFLSKPSMYGAGVNLQQSHSMAFAGVGYKFHEVIQGVHRIHRFLQKHDCDVHFIHTEAERPVRVSFEGKWKNHDELVGQMAAQVRERGLARAAVTGLSRSSSVDRVVVAGRGWRLVNNDSVLEAQLAPTNHFGLILTSIPFSTQYEYTPSLYDFGHTDDVAHFFRQMDYLTPELLRVLQPGRIAAIHVKDRIVPGGLTKLGFQTVQPFHADCIAHYMRHGFAYLGMKTITTDVVRENNQTYRLGHTEQCKDGSRMGVGMPEYLLLFRKPPTDASNGYADVPVVKSKAEYSLGRWQVDAHGYARSSGNRLLTPADLEGVSHEAIYKLWKRFNSGTVYDYEHHVALCDSLRARGLLPVTFMLLPPHSPHSDVWTDITRMRTLNGMQHAKGRELHLCPIQIDVVDRAIIQYSNPGDRVLDPFSGLGTTSLRSLELGRIGEGWELSNTYHLDGVLYHRAAEEKRGAPTLFDLLDVLEPEEAARAS